MFQMIAGVELEYDGIISEVFLMAIQMAVVCR